MKEIYIQYIAGLLQVRDWQVENCAELIAEGCTIPFISRYRKERTGGLDDVSVAEVKHWCEVFGEMEKRKATILTTIGEAGKLSAVLAAKTAPFVRSAEKGVQNAVKAPVVNTPAPAAKAAESKASVKK